MAQDRKQAYLCPTLPPHRCETQMFLACQTKASAASWASIIQLAVFLNMETWEWPLLQWRFCRTDKASLVTFSQWGWHRTRRKYSPMVCKIHKENSPIDICAKCYRRLFIVRHTHCVLVSSMVNDYVERTEVTYIVKGQARQQSIKSHHACRYTVSYSLL